MPNDNYYLIDQTASQQPKPFSEESTNGTLFNNETRIVSLVLSKKKKGKNAQPTLETETSGKDEEKDISFQIIPWKPTVSLSPPLDSIIFKESIFDGCMFGSMTVTDDRNWIDEFQFTGDEELNLEFSIGKSEEVIKLKFQIYNAKNISNEATNFEPNIVNERISFWRLDFIGSEIFLPNYNLSPLDDKKDFIGLLSSTQTTENETLSLVEHLFKKYSLPISKIDKSRSGVWLKYDHVSYPWMKNKGQLRISQLLKYLANYAWDGDYDHYHADYFFWQDRDGYNFRSITKMLGQDENGYPISVLPVEGFLVTIDLTNPNRLISTQVLNAYNIQELLENGSIFSYYRRVDPNYDNTYIDFTDSRESFKYKDLIYDYSKYKEDVVQIEEFFLLPDSFEGKTLTDAGTPNFMVRVDDEIYGYFNDNYLNSPYSQSWEQYGRTLSGPWASSTKSWQPQFDLTDLEYDKFKIIHLNIRESLKAKREEYARKKNIKRKWEVYRCTICCHENGALGSTADIALLMNASGQTGLTYALLFGPTGLYASTDESYKVVAAGSFTDTLNYTKGNTYYERGLTYSYDLTKEPYNQTLGNFFNITGPTAPEAYTQFVIQRATHQYDILIQQLQDRIEDLDDFIQNRVVTYRSAAEAFFKSVQIETVGDDEREIKAPDARPIDLLTGINNRFMGDAIIGEQTIDWPITSYEFGMVPHSKVEPNKGVAQVIFGEDPNPQFAPLRSFAGPGDPPGSGGCPEGTVQRCCNCCSGEPGNEGVIETTCKCIVIDDNFDENVDNYVWIECQGFLEVGGGGLPIGEAGRSRCNCQAAEDRSSEGLPCGPNQYLSDENGDGVPECITCSLEEGTQYPCYPECPGGDFPCCITASNGSFCTCLSESECAAANGSQLESCDYCFDTDNGSCPQGKIHCCYNGQYCGCASTQTCSENSGQQVESCDECGISGPDGTATGGDLIVIVIQGPTGPTGPTGPSGGGLPTEKDVIYKDPCELKECSTDPIIRGYIKHTQKETVADNSPIYIYAAPYLWDESEVSDWSFYDYGTEAGLIPGVVDIEIKDKTTTCLENCACYNTTCLSAVGLEVLRRTCVAEKQLLTVELELLKDLKSKIEETYQSTWTAAYAEWHQRNAFFFSKKPGTSVFRNETRDTIQSRNSLENIKSITRKEVRGSRYELLSNKLGITGASAGEWIYNIWFGGETGSTGHPYYDQQYKENGFITSRKPHSWFGFTDADGTDDPIFFDGGKFRVEEAEIDSSPEFRGEEYVENSAIHIGTNDLQDIVYGSELELKNYGFAQSDLLGAGGGTIRTLEDVKKFRNTFNFFNTNGKKPPNVKKEEITSYIRIEFVSPIGLDRIKDFPNGFVRDAGVEYFLPYLVNLTVGPMGRHGVKYNAAVIGIDPYGFDVAVKKIKDDLPTNRKLQGVDKGNYYKWWNHDTGTVLANSDYLTPDYNGMDLWPELGFETEFPYYSYDPSQEDLHGGGYDMDYHMGGGYYFENSSQNWMESLYHYGMSSSKQFDPLYRTSVVGSYILPNSYRKLKPHRSWWSLFVPRNLFVPIRFANMFKSPNTKARDLFGGRGIFTVSPNYWRTWYGNEFSNWVSLSKNQMTSLVQESAPDVNFFFDDNDLTNEEESRVYISPHSENTQLNGYFRDSLMYYLAGNYIMYRPGLVSQDLWKWDLSGETEYGLVTPPVDTEYDFFDRNFSMQFVVHARGTKTCKDLGLSCANPSAIKDGLVLAADGCTASPYCNCPAQYLMPTEPEPTYLELEMLKHKINECSLIEEYLGKEWLGCEFSDPNSSCSCNCPEQGPHFKDYLEYTRTYSTFWECPLDLPLRRRAQISQLISQRVRILINPNDKIKLGSIIELHNPNDLPDSTKNKFKKISGRWMVAEISHIIKVNNYFMDLIVVRNSLHYDPNESQSPKYIFTEDPDSEQN